MRNVGSNQKEGRLVLKGSGDLQRNKERNRERPAVA